MFTHHVSRKRTFNFSIIWRMLICAAGGVFAFDGLAPFFIV
jgi:hypothetical protein